MLLWNEKQMINYFHFNFCLYFVRFPQLRFEYKDPDKAFDRKSVHGLVVRLITVKDPHTATALEVSAGGKVNHLTSLAQWVISSFSVMKFGSYLLEIKLLDLSNYRIQLLILPLADAPFHFLSFKHNNAPLMP